MKKVVSVFLCVLLLFSVLSVSASAQEPEDILVSRKVEVLENGDQIITEIYLNAVQPMTGISGHATRTYKDAFGTAMWAVVVNGTFNYTYGVSCEATYAGVVVPIYDSGCSVVSKNAYTHSNAATATCSVQYGHSVTNGSVTLYCDVYGNLS